jgi:transcriptional regulator with XRE-family HTH domain
LGEGHAFGYSNSEPARALQTDVISSGGKNSMKKIKELRDLAGWNQTRLAARSGIHRAKISLAETGELQLSPVELSKIERVLIAAIRRRNARIQGILFAPQQAAVETSGAGTTA